LAQKTSVARSEKLFFLHEVHGRRTEIRASILRFRIHRQERFDFLIGGNAEGIGLHRHDPLRLGGRQRFQFDFVFLEGAIGLGNFDGLARDAPDLRFVDLIAGGKSPRAIDQDPHPEACVGGVADELDFFFAGIDGFVLVFVQPNIDVAGAELFRGVEG